MPRAGTHAFGVRAAGVSTGTVGPGIGTRSGIPVDQGSVRPVATITPGLGDSLAATINAVLAPSVLSGARTAPGSSGRHACIAGQGIP